MPTSCGFEVLPLYAARGHAQAVPGAARDHQCRVRTLHHPRRGVYIHRQDRDNGQDTAQGAWGTEMYSLLGACKVLGKDPGTVARPYAETHRVNKTREPPPPPAGGVDGVTFLTFLTRKTSINKAIAAMEYPAAQFPPTSWRGAFTVNLQ